MTPDEQVASTARGHSRARSSRIGKWLVALGVSVWPIWGALWLAGRALHIGLAVVSHLALVIPGGMLMRSASPDEAAAVVRRKRLGTLLITFGVLAWVPYFLAQEVADREIESVPFLLWHLSGVIPGALLRYTRIGFRQ